MIDKLNDLFDNISIEDLEQLDCPMPKVKISRKSKKKIHSLTQRKVDNKVRKISFKRPVAILLASIITVVGTVTAVAFHSNNKELIAKYFSESAAENYAVDNSQKPIEVSENKHIKATANMVLNDGNVFNVLISFEGKDEISKRIIELKAFEAIVSLDNKERTLLSREIGESRSSHSPSNGTGDMMLYLKNPNELNTCENIIIEFSNYDADKNKNYFEGIELNVSTKQNIESTKFLSKEGLELDLSKLSMYIHIDDFEGNINESEINKEIAKVRSVYVNYDFKIIKNNGKELTISDIGLRPAGTSSGKGYSQSFILNFNDVSDVKEILINGVKFNKVKQNKR